MQSFHPMACRCQCTVEYSGWPPEGAGLGHATTTIFLLSHLHLESLSQDPPYFQTIFLLLIVLLCCCLLLCVWGGGLLSLFEVSLSHRSNHAASVTMQSRQQQQKEVSILLFHQQTSPTDLNRVQHPKRYSRVSLCMNIHVCCGGLLVTLHSASSSLAPPTMSLWSETTSTVHRAFNTNN